MKDTKHIRRDFYSFAWVMPHGCPGGQQNFFKHGHVAYQIDGDDEQNKKQVAFLSLGQTGDLGARSKGQISLTCQFQRFLYQTLCVFSQIKIENILNRIFILLPRSCPVVGLRGAGGVKNFCVGICDGPPSTARSSLNWKHYRTHTISKYLIWVNIVCHI